MVGPSVRLAAKFAALGIAISTCVIAACAGPNQQVVPSRPLIERGSARPQAPLVKRVNGTIKISPEKIAIMPGRHRVAVVQTSLPRVAGRPRMHPLIASPTPTPIADIIVYQGSPRTIGYTYANANPPIDPSCGNILWTFTSNIPQATVAYNPASQETAISGVMYVTVSTSSGTPITPIGGDYSIEAAGTCTNPNATGNLPAPIGPNSLAVVTETMYDLVNNQSLFSEPQPLQRVIGQYNSVAVSPQPQATLANQQWTYPGTVVKTYVMTSSSGTETDLSSDDLSSIGISFSWLSPTSGQLSFQATWPGFVSGGDLTATLFDTYAVQGPTNPMLSSTTTSVLVAPDVISPPDWFIGFGNGFNGGSPPGITFEFTASAPASPTGQYAGTQLINSNTTVVAEPSTSPSYRTTNGQTCLDNDVFDYGPVSASNGILTGLDAPGSLLTAQVAQLTRTDSFSTYFMYRPDGDSRNIWVSLGRLDWGWQGTATQVGTSGTFTGGGTATPNPSGVASFALPQWTCQFVNG
jgi:hypothetical protein